jgi:transposase, IS30 family
MPGTKYTDEQKLKFFDLLDMGGSVRAAARAAGAHEAAASSLIRAAGLTMQRATPRIYTDDEKAEFFRRLAKRPNMSAVASEHACRRR